MTHGLGWWGRAGSPVSISPDGAGPVRALQAAAFLDALDAGDPTLALSSYADALRTDRLTRAVVAATSARG